MHLNHIARLGVLLAAAGGLACTDSTSPPSGTARLVVRMTDAPFPFADVASVDMFVVRVDGRNGAATDAEIADVNGTDGWIAVAEPGAAFNLLDLQGGKTVNLGAATLATGIYNSFRLVLDTDQSSITLQDGTVLTGTSDPGIKFPSAAQTGIKILLDAPIQVVQDSSVMILDFDVGRSFVLRGNSIKNNGLLFKPVIRATASELTGSVSGSVRAESATGEGVADATVELLKEGTPVDDTDEENVIATTSTDASGDFRFGFILPGVYEIRATPPEASGFAPALLAGGVTIVSGTEVTDRIIVVAP